MKLNESFLPISWEEGLPTFNQTFVGSQINYGAKLLKENLHYSLSHHRKVQSGQEVADWAPNTTC